MSSQLILMSNICPVVLQPLLILAQVTGYELSLVPERWSRHPPTNATWVSPCAVVSPSSIFQHLPSQSSSIQHHHPTGMCGSNAAHLVVLFLSLPYAHLAVLFLSQCAAICTSGGVVVGQQHMPNNIRQSATVIQPTMHAHCVQHIRKSVHK